MKRKWFGNGDTVEVGRLLVDDRWPRGPSCAYVSFIGNGASVHMAGGRYRDLPGNGAHSHARMTAWAQAAVYFGDRQ